MDRSNVIAKVMSKLSGVDSGAVHVKNEDMLKALKLIKERGIKILHIEDISEGEQTIFMNVFNIEIAAELLEQEGINSTRSH